VKVCTLPRPSKTSHRRTVRSHEHVASSGCAVLGREGEGS
jgi:hypothetical protein